MRRARARALGAFSLRQLTSPHGAWEVQATIGGWDAKDHLAARGGRRALPARAGECAVLPAATDSATEISSAKVCGATECRGSPIRRRRRRSRSAPAPGVGTPPSAGCPGTRARSRSPPSTAARCAPPSSWCPPPGCWACRAGRLGDPAEREQRGLRDAHSRAYAPPGEDASGRGRGRQAVTRVDDVVEPRRAATPAPASDGSNVWIVALGGGVLAALMAGLLLRIRHRRASTPPAALEAPG